MMNTDLRTLFFLNSMLLLYILRFGLIVSFHTRFFFLRICFTVVRQCDLLDLFIRDNTYALARKIDILFIDVSYSLQILLILYPCSLIFFVTFYLQFVFRILFRSVIPKGLIGVTVVCLPSTTSIRYTGCLAKSNSYVISLKITQPNSPPAHDQILCRLN